MQDLHQNHVLVIVASCKNITIIITIENNNEDIISSLTKIAECFNDYFVKVDPIIASSIDGC